MTTTRRRKPPRDTRRAGKKAAPEETPVETPPETLGDAAQEPELVIPEIASAEIATADLDPPEVEPTEIGIPEPGSVVPVSADPLRRYLAEIRAYPQLTREEQHDLALRVREKGDKEAAFRLATSNLRLVVRIAMDYRRSYLNLLDLVQEGNVGLLQAVGKYDPYRGVPFSAYAGYWIRAYILKYLLDHWSLVRVGTTNIRRKLFYNLKREQQRLRSLGVEPGPKLLARNLGAGEQDVIEVGAALKARDLSIDQPAGPPGDEQDRFVWETMAAGGAGPEDQVAREEMQGILKEKIAAFAAGLKEKERYILESRLLADEPLTLQAIGDHFGTTREAVRQTEARLISRLKEYLRAEISDLKRFEVKTD
jgi:RNA polymerase sigma-32 factor